MPMVETRRLIDLTDEEFNRCRVLTYGIDGFMEEEAVERREQEILFTHYRYTEVILAYDHKQIVGWCLLQPVYRQSRYLAYFFVDPLRRGEGYGKLLFERASRYGLRKLMVKPDRTNYNFFERFKTQWIEQSEDAKV